MADERIGDFIRHFPENSFKRLLKNPGNVRDALALAGAPMLDRIDFARMKPTDATFVQSDYRHIAADLVLTAPLLPAKGKKHGRNITVYILIEHQSEPERLMPLRVLEYVIEVYKAQLRDWPRNRAERAGMLLDPVLPVVFYAGDRTWDELGTLADLIAEGQLFDTATPLMKPLFLNVRALAPGAGVAGRTVRPGAAPVAQTKGEVGRVRRVAGRGGDAGG